MTTLRFLHPALVAGLLTAAALPAHGQLPPDLASGFDADTGNWRASDAGAVLTWVATGGTAGGYLRGQGPGGNWHLVSPAAWAGDWTGYQAMKFDLGIPSRHYADNDIAGMVVIVGANAHTMTWTGPTPLWSWTHYEISLDPVSFGVDQATFDGIMADVAEVRILAEFNAAAGETVGLDSVLVTATPIEVFDEDLVARFTGAVKSGNLVDGWGPVDDVTLSPSDDGWPLHGLYCDDWQDGRTFRVVSPVSWAGDWRGFNEIRFDYKWTSSGTAAGDDILQIFGANGQVLTWDTTVTKGQWNHFTVPLTPGTFGVDQATFDGVMSFVSKIWIRGEYDAGNDQLWLDNIVVATGPETPRTLADSVVSRFGAGSEGWIAFGNASLAWNGSAGFIGGAISCTDLGSGVASFSSPDSWSGDWSNFESLRFLLRIAAGADYPPDLTIHGFNGQTLSVSPPPPYPTWTPYTIDLRPATFGVSQAEFDAVIGNVAHVAIRADLLNTNDTTWLDDISLQAQGGFAQAPPDRVSTFDSDNEGWRKGGNSNGQWGLLGSAPNHSPAGNPGGSITVNDEYGLTYWFTPSGWAGDWRGYESVAFDLRILSGTNRLAPDTMIAVISAHGSLTQAVTQSPALGQWNHYEFALTPAAFGVTQEQFDTVMRDVVMLGIRAEWINGSETEALDNVRLSKAPEAYWLWIAGYLDPSELGDETIAGKEADPDHDGATNWDEYLALTDPTDPLSRFLASGRRDASGFTVSYQTRSGRVYQVWKSNSLGAADPWSRVGPVENGDNTIKSHTETATEPAAFFRVTVQVPE